MENAEGETTLHFVFTIDLSNFYGKLKDTKFIIK